MAIGADGDQVVDGVEAIALASRRDGHKMVDMDKAVPWLSIDLSELHVAHLAGWAKVGYASQTSVTVALVAIHEDSNGSALKELAVGDQFLTVAPAPPGILSGGVAPELLEEVDRVGGQLAELSNLLLVNLAVFEGEPVAWLGTFEPKPPGYWVERKFPYRLCGAGDSENVVGTLVEIAPAEFSGGGPRPTAFPNLDASNEQETVGLSLNVHNPDRVTGAHLVEVLAHGVVEKVPCSGLLERGLHRTPLPVPHVVGHQPSPAIMSIE
jgi:hypothetical protein